MTGVNFFVRLYEISMHQQVTNLISIISSLSSIYQCRYSSCYTPCSQKHLFLLYSLALPNPHSFFHILYIHIRAMTLSRAMLMLTLMLGLAATSIAQGPTSSPPTMPPAGVSTPPTISTPPPVMTPPPAV